MKPREKLKQLREKENLSQSAFSLKYGSRKEAVKNIENGRQDINKDLAKALEKEYKIPFKWWMTGEGPETMDDQTSLVESDCVDLPLITASAGGGYALLENEKVSVPKTELINLGFLKFVDLVAVKISGCSMQPTINNGDILIAHTVVENIVDNGIYVLNYGGDLYCKRVLKGLTYIKLKSDNPEYDIEKIEHQEREKLSIIGRVIFRMNAV